MNRRTFLDGIIKTAIVSTTSTIIADKEYCNRKEKTVLQTDMDDICATFPLKIPGAKRIEKIVTERSEYCIIHIKTAHPSDDKYMVQRYGNGTVAEFVTRVQKNVLKIGTFICQKYSLENLYAEGVTLDSEQVLNDAFRNNDLEIILQALEQMGEIARIGFLGIHIRAAESEKLNEIAISAVNETGPKKRKEYTEDQQKKIFDDREKEAFKRMMQEKDPLKLIAYGGEHTFRYEIEKWNTYHNQKISLIEITPSEDK